MCVYSKTTAFTKSSSASTSLLWDRDICVRMMKRWWRKYFHNEKREKEEEYSMLILTWAKQLPPAEIALLSFCSNKATAKKAFLKWKQLRKWKFIIYWHISEYFPSSSTVADTFTDRWWALRVSVFRKRQKEICVYVYSTLLLTSTLLSQTKYRIMVTDFILWCGIGMTNS